MAVPTIIVTGLKEVDLELGYMMKWHLNGAHDMAFNHSMRAGMLLLKEVAQGNARQRDAKKFIDFVGEVLYGEQNP